MSRDTMCPADRSERLEALSMAAIAFFKENFDTQGQEGALMRSLLIILNEEAQATSSMLLDIADDNHGLQIQLANETKPPPEPRPPVSHSTAYETLGAKEAEAA